MASLRIGLRNQRREDAARRRRLQEHAHEWQLINDALLLTGLQRQTKARYRA